jgi:dynein light intermediate chain, axonemal
MRKQLQAEHGKADLEKRIAELEAKRTKQENKVIELKSKIEAIEKKNAERREVEAKKRLDEIAFLKYQEGHLNKYLKQVNNDK